MGHEYVPAVLSNVASAVRRDNDTLPSNSMNSNTYPLRDTWVPRVSTTWLLLHSRLVSSVEVLSTVNDVGVSTPLEPSAFHRRANSHGVEEGFVEGAGGGRDGNVPNRITRAVVN